MKSYLCLYSRKFRDNLDNAPYCAVSPDIPSTVYCLRLPHLLHEGIVKDTVIHRDHVDRQQNPLSLDIGVLRIQ